MNTGVGTVPGRPLLFYLALVLGTAGAAGAESESSGGLDAADLSLAWTSLQMTLETHSSESPGAWQNDSTGHWGTITPLRTFRIETGFFCREYRETASSGGRIRLSTGTACRNADGVWIPVER